MCTKVLEEAYYIVTMDVGLGKRNLEYVRKYGISRTQLS